MIGKLTLMGGMLTFVKYHLVLQVEAWDLYG